ncbi:proline--tRNA ligase [Paenibacillus filicis]|uniref:Proline--tRNA ligase n=1 Tax=Paenibacillus gyeongsangnamensis TaxID=3388067 RepID=A0ABT4QCU7_9BACL|nr:proline--tRNA ligase [Paenibacillus filicis]MCZ8514691.1 proline--tRNA ligase [Paenibacillus filicis]
MRQQHFLMPTLREVPADAETASHRLLLRGGYIRQLAAGVYTYLPLGQRVLRNLERIIREEMDAIGAQELLMPAMQPAPLWEQSGRYAVYGPELIRLEDRHGREFALGPTHEEVVTALIRDEIQSYRKLPLLVYQIQTKFRDERRPRFGLLRGREFLMKDAYSFAADEEQLDAIYASMTQAYNRIFTRCGLRFRAVEADSGSIGGEGGSHEFMAIADIGEDRIVTCTDCGYAANVEQADTGLPQQEKRETPEPAAEKFATPGIHTIAELEQALGVSSKQLLKTLIYEADGRAVAVLVRGDRSVNEIRLQRILHAEQIELADADTVLRLTGCPIGFVGPAGLRMPLLVDREAAAVSSAIAGSGEAGYHLRHVQPGRDFPVEHVYDLRLAAEGDRCPRCEGTLRSSRGIEVGHVFKLGTRYSAKLGASFAGASGEQRPMIMGCYGIGVSRLVSVIAEQRHEETGLLWPMAVAPFQVHVIPVSVQDEEQMLGAEALYRRLRAQGIEALLDDRQERPGMKFKDADLIGAPIRIVFGRKASEGLVEYKERQEANSLEVTVEEAYERIVRLCLN